MVVNISAIGNSKYVLTVVDEGADKYYVKSKTDALTAMRTVAQEIKSIKKNDLVQNLKYLKILDRASTLYEKTYQTPVRIYYHFLRA